MSSRDTLPCVEYKKMWTNISDVQHVKLEQQYDDGSTRKMICPVDDGSRGIEFTITVVVDTFKKLLAA